MDDGFAAKRETDGQDDEAVAGYLLEHPGFLDRHPEVLEALEAGCRRDGAVSLVEKQLAVLRKRHRDVEASRDELVETARANQKLSICLHEVALELLRGAALDRASASRLDKARRVSRSCHAVLRGNIPDLHVVVHWFREFLSPADPAASDDLVVTSEKDQRIAGRVNALFATGEPGCGPFSAPERVVLLDRFAAAARSEVAVALAEPGTGGRAGVLVLASDKPARFARGKGTMFLVQLVQLIECALTPPGE